VALLEKAAGQGHVYAMCTLRGIHHKRKEHEQAMRWATQAAEAGLPKAMFSLGCSFDKGEGMAAPDYPAAADWYRRAVDAGSGKSAKNLASMYTLGRGAARQIMPAAISDTF
jgi:TPR repeat protein